MKVRDRWDRWASLDAAAVFVVFDDPGMIRETMLEGIEVDDLPFSVLVDRDREAYRRWGLKRARWWTIWLDPKVRKQYRDLLRAGDRKRPGGEDAYQLGGDFVIAPGGSVAYARPQRRDDRPPVGELLQAARAAVEADTTDGGGDR